MSEIRVSTIVNEANTDGPLLAGITSVTDTTQSTSTTTGAFVVSGGVGIAKSLNVGGNVTVGGTLTYEDVTNVDVLGIATYRGGVEFGVAGVGGTVSALGHAEFTGIVTASSFSGNSTSATVATNVTLADESSDTSCNVLFATGATGDLAPKTGTNLTFDSADGKLTATQFIGVATGGTASGSSVGVGTTATILGVTDGATQNRFSGILVEKAAIQDTNITASGAHVDPANGNVHYFTTNGSGASTVDIVYKGGNNLSSYMKVGENIALSVISKPNNSEYVNAVTIDGAAVTEEWSGGSTPSAASGAASSYTITTINITRIASTGTPNSDYLVLCAFTNYA